MGNEARAKHHKHLSFLSYISHCYTDCYTNTTHFITIFTARVPEDKCHMVLPEIEEEDEENHRLSLTSLLLGQEPPALPHPRTWLRS